MHNDVKYALRLAKNKAGQRRKYAVGGNPTDLTTASPLTMAAPTTAQPQDLNSQISNLANQYLGNLDPTVTSYIGNQVNQGKYTLPQVQNWFQTPEAQSWYASFNKPASPTAYDPGPTTGNSGGSNQSQSMQYYQGLINSGFSPDQATNIINSGGDVSFSPVVASDNSDSANLQNYYTQVTGQKLTSDQVNELNSALQNKTYTPQQIENTWQNSDMAKTYDTNTLNSMVSDLSGGQLSPSDMQSLVSQIQSGNMSLNDVASYLGQTAQGAQGYWNSYNGANLNTSVPQNTVGPNDFAAGTNVSGNVQNASIIDPSIKALSPSVQQAIADMGGYGYSPTAISSLLSNQGYNIPANAIQNSMYGLLSSPATPAASTGAGSSEGTPSTGGSLSTTGTPISTGTYTNPTTNVSTGVPNASMIDSSIQSLPSNAQQAIVDMSSYGYSPSTISTLLNSQGYNIPANAIQSSLYGLITQSGNNTVGANDFAGNITSANGLGQTPAGMPTDPASQNIVPLNQPTTMVDEPTTPGVIPNVIQPQQTLPDINITGKPGAIVDQPTSPSGIPEVMQPQQTLPAINISGKPAAIVDQPTSPSGIPNVMQPETPATGSVSTGPTTTPAPTNNSIGDTIGNVASNIGSALGNAATGVGNAVAGTPNLLGQLSTAVQNLAQPAMNAIGNLPASIANAVGGASLVDGNLKFNSVGGFDTGKLTGALAGAQQAVSNAAAQAANFINSNPLTPEQQQYLQQMSGQETGVQKSVNAALTAQSGTGPSGPFQVSNSTGRAFNKQIGITGLTPAQQDSLKTNTSPAGNVINYAQGVASVVTNSNLLKQAGLPVNSENLYSVHNLGAGDGIKLAKAAQNNPNALITNIGLQPNSYNLNRGLYFSNGKPVTVSQAMQNIKNQLNNSAKNAQGVQNVNALQTGATTGAKPDVKVPPNIPTSTVPNDPNAVQNALGNLNTTVGNQIIQQTQGSTAQTGFPTSNVPGSDAQGTLESLPSVNSGSISTDPNAGAPSDQGAALSGDGSQMVASTSTIQVPVQISVPKTITVPGQMKTFTGPDGNSISYQEPATTKTVMTTQTQMQSKDVTTQVPAWQKEGFQSQADYQAAVDNGNTSASQYYASPEYAQAQQEQLDAQAQDAGWSSYADQQNAAGQGWSTPAEEMAWNDATTGANFFGDSWSGMDSGATGGRMTINKLRNKALKVADRLTRSKRASGGKNLNPYSFVTPDRAKKNSILEYNRLHPKSYEQQKAEAEELAKRKPVDEWYEPWSKKEDRGKAIYPEDYQKGNLGLGQYAMKKGGAVEDALRLAKRRKSAR